MKILKIEFQNINSLKGEHLIDFTQAPFTESSLFAITGPTGSGKSTILDVIALGLFNQVPRIGKISRTEIINKGAILTRNQKEAYAKITYSCKKGNFESTWSISTNRNDNLRDYEMQLCNIDTNELFDLKKSDVPAKNESLIGLNYNQFIKSVLLAQGEFAQFLKVKKDERGELLEKITGTWIYREIGRQAFEKHKLVSKEIENQQLDIASITEKLLDPRTKTQLENELENWQKTLDSHQKAIKLFEQKIDLKAKLLKQQEDIQKIENEKTETESQLKVFQDSNGTKLHNHQKVNAQAENLGKWKDTQEDLHKLSEEQATLAKKQTLNRENSSKTLAEVALFIQTEVTEKTFEDQLDKFRIEVSTMRDQLFEKGEQKKREQGKLTAEMRDLELDLDQSTADLKKEIIKLKREIDSEITGLKKQAQITEEININAEETRLRGLERQAQEAKSLSEKITNTQTEITSTTAEFEQFSAELKKLPLELKNLQTTEKLNQVQLDQLREQEKYEARIASLESTRADLIEGEPCPLCGALHHPFAIAHPVLDNVLKQNIKRAAEKLTGTQKEVTQKEVQVSFNQKQLAKAEEKLKKLQAEEASFLEEFNKKYAASFALNENWSVYLKNIDTQIETLAIYEKMVQKQSAINRSMPIINQLESIEEEGLKLKDAYRDLYQGNDVNKEVQDFQTKWTRYQQEQKGLANRSEELAKEIAITTQEFETLSKELTAFISTKEIATIEAALQFLLPHVDYEHLRKAQENFTSKITNQNTALNLLQEQLIDLQKNDAEETTEAIQLSLKEVTNQYKTLNDQSENHRRLLRNDAEDQAELKTIQAAIAEREKAIRRWRLLNELIGDSQGKKFNEFAQDLTLSQLIRLANKRLESLSDRYRIDKSIDEEDDSLVAIDDHMGGQRRSVKTLSGGETFILSLSMALALSDLASKNVEINSLFIDEGFGTLDPETLDQTLDTLEKLQAESSKTIGIISHVDSLKERIATQIQLTRNGQGYSTLKIV